MHLLHRFIINNRLWPVGVFLVLACSGLAAPKLPPGFKATTLVRDINGATAMTIAPDGRVFYAEQTGAIYVVKDGKRLARPALDLKDRLDTWWERGLIGLTLHPDFPHTPYLYTVYVAREPHTHHVISRFTVVGNTLDPNSEMILLKGDDQSKLGGKVPAGHQGGPICFGRDGMIYVGLGEQTAGKPSQALDSLLGKILRLHPDGSIPKDNPFYQQTQGKYRAIYARGIRNPFGLATDPVTGRLLETDVGGSAFEEINEIIAGGNYGWPQAEGPSSNPKYINPLHAYKPTVGRSICGGMFYPTTGNFPDTWKGKFFFVDWASHWVKAIDPDNPEKLISFATGFSAPVGLAAAPGGSVYVLNRNTRWRDGKKYKANSGSLVRIDYVGESLAPGVPTRHPQTLTEAGVFADLKSLQPAPGFVSFQLNAPVWIPGVQARRWISIPDGSTIHTDPTNHWRLPKGSIVVQHFDTLGGRRHETHIYRANEDATFKAAAYRWNDDQAEGQLVEDGEIIPIPGSDPFQWYSPGTEMGLNPELSLVGFILQLNTRQLNRGHQLAAWRERGWLSQQLTDDILGTFPRLAALDDDSASLAHRVRSHLDANCASCHRPGGPSRGLFDARYMTPLPDQNMVDGPLMAGDLGIQEARVLVPGSPDRSLLLQRMKRHDAFRMPPIAVNDVPSPVIPLIEQWIREWPTDRPTKGSVRLLRDAVDVSAGNLPAYKIETPTATYYLEKSGAGLSSLVDRDGNDWLGFHPAPGSGAGGEYRGFPNAVHQQAGNYFHARNQATDPAHTRVVLETPDQVTIVAEGHNGLWACRYVFRATHATFTMTRMPPDKKYWALYEGIPGGDYDDTDWWITSGMKDKQPLTRKHNKDIPAPEWIAFGDPRLKRSLFLYHHEDDAHPDYYYAMQKKMTVFGFGRKGIDKFLDSVPQSISIGLLETDEAGNIGEAIETLCMEKGK